MRRIIALTGLVGMGLLSAYEIDGGASVAANAQAVTAGRGYCSGSGNPPSVFEPKFTQRRLPSRYCDNTKVVGLNNAVLNAGTNWAVCQTTLGPGWYVYTQGDSGPGIVNAWDWFDAAKFSGGEAGGPIPGLVNCSFYGFPP
jgi:hypothetical protein